MSWDVVGQPGRERRASGRCEVPRGLRDITVCRMMSRDVAKGLDPKRDEQEMSCTAGDKTYRGRQVGSGRHGKTDWGKGVPLTSSPFVLCFLLYRHEV